VSECRLACTQPRKRPSSERRLERRFEPPLANLPEIRASSGRRFCVVSSKKALVGGQVTGSGSSEADSETKEDD